jgi:predicted RNase H-related nuclease YkuK (DUF458 family)
MKEVKKEWRKLQGDTVGVNISEEIDQVLAREMASGNELKVCIGTDSQVKSSTIEFATVIVFLRKGKGGFMYIQESESTQKMKIRERMLAEVAKTIEVAFNLSDIIYKYNVALEVHVDINTKPDFKSHDALQEALGYIKGMGFAFKAKPDAFASSCCANKIVQ